MAKVSIIVAIYNQEKYLNRCVDSLVNQTLQDIEIILVNDGSEDSSAEIAKKYVVKDPDRVLYFEKENGGLSDARNYGLKYATGEYISFVDSDDYITENLYTDLHALIQEILKLPKHVIHDKWFDVRGYVFKEIPNAIETNHGYQYKNRILFLYDSTSDNFVKSNWVKYYRNRGIKTKFLDYQTYENLTIFIDWLKNS